MRGIARLALVVVAVVVAVQVVRWGLSRRTATTATEAEWPRFAAGGPEVRADAGLGAGIDAGIGTGVDRPGWVEPEDTGTCPMTHPVKVKAGSGIFHLPGGRFYERTRPDRCYANAGAAEADGFRASKL